MPDVQSLIERRRGNPKLRISIPEFWKAMEAIPFEEKGHSAAQILESLIRYDRIQKNSEIKPLSLRSLAYLKGFLNPDEMRKTRRRL